MEFAIKTEMQSALGAMKCNVLYYRSNEESKTTKQNTFSLVCF
jgi:hypothetical protein